MTKKFVLKALIYLIYLGQLEYTYNMLIYYNYNKTDKDKLKCGKKIKSSSPLIANASKPFFSSSKMEMKMLTLQVLALLKARKSSLTQLVK